MASAGRSIVAAVNPRSGGNKGQAALVQLTSLIGAEQVFDLTAEMRSPGTLAPQLHKWAREARPTGVRPALLVCGGDGTVSWLLTALVESDLIGWFSVATIPLGTANDFARVMGWNNAYFSGIVEDAIERLQGRRDELLAQQFDVWNVSQFRGPALQTPADFEAHGQALRTLPIINYFSIGFDAKVAFEFNSMRDRHPRTLKSRPANMAAYGCLGAKSSCLCCCCATPPGLNSLGMTVTVDGQDVPLPRGARGVTVINVPSYANGTQPWGSPGNGSAFDGGTVDDGRIEVFAVLGSEHMGCIQARATRGIRVGQGAVVEFSVPTNPGSRPRQLYIQNDGEAQPFTAGGCFANCPPASF
jgi:diacylglycerol kinase (ATP)